MPEHEHNYLHWDCVPGVARVMGVVGISIFLMWSGISNYVLDWAITGALTLGEYL